jgi:DNA invertase Pin-like site-specific DNA recombinase
MKLVGYARVSSQEQKANGLSIPDQHKALKAWAKANGHRLVSIHDDEAISGSNGIEDREGLPDALNLIKAGKAQGFVTLNLYRFARNLTVQEVTLGKLWDMGATVFTVEDGEVSQDDPDDPFRTTMRQIRGAFSQLEAAMIRQRMEAGRRAKAERGGLYLHGAPPFGMRPDPGTHELVEDDREQAVLRRMRELRDAGLTLVRVGDVLAEEGHHPRRAERWSPAMLSQTLNRS